jgi:hypothetical protein
LRCGSGQRGCVRQRGGEQHGAHTHRDAGQSAAGAGERAAQTGETRETRGTSRRSHGSLHRIPFGLGQGWTQLDNLARYRTQGNRLPKGVDSSPAGAGRRQNLDAKVGQPAGSRHPPMTGRYYFDYNKCYRIVIFITTGSGNPSPVFLAEVLRGHARFLAFLCASGTCARRARRRTRSGAAIGGAAAVTAQARGRTQGTAGMRRADADSSRGHGRTKGLPCRDTGPGPAAVGVNGA